MADGLPINQVKLQKKKKAQLHALRDLCPELKKSLHMFWSENEMWTFGRGRDIRSDANSFGCPWFTQKYCSALRVNLMWRSKAAHHVNIKVK